MPEQIPVPEQTTHPTPTDLHAYGLGQLPPDEATAIERHISECDPCCETIADLSTDDTFIELLRNSDQDPNAQTADQHSGTVNQSSAGVPEPLAQHPRYEIIDLIGKGGMGDVYQARHRKMERTVALKVINRGLVRKAEAIDRFHREVKAAAQLSHPNIVTAYDADQAGDFHFMVMEHVDGVDLSQTVKQRGALPVAEACDYIRQAAIGLQHAHQRGMVHRDIKPHNMMVTADGTVKILDFGLASLAPEALVDADSVEACGELTAAGAIMGTPDFISPEQAQDARQADIRSDIYSLGATLYFLLSGRPLFADGSVMHKVNSHANAEPEPLESLRDDLPPKLAAVVSRMIAKDPGERFQTPAEVVEALESVDQVVQPSKAPEPVLQVQPSRRRIGWLPLTAIASIFFAAIFASLVYYIQTNSGIVRVEVADDSLTVDISGHTITAKDGNKEPVEIHVGDCVLKVRQGDFQFETESFQIRRNEKIALKVERLEGEVVVSKDGERFHSQALSDDIDVRQILDGMTKAYADCESYHDSGVIKSVFLRNTVSPDFTVQHSFTTAFVRPDRFRFEIKNEENRLLISANGKNVQTWWDVEPGIQKPESLEFAMAQAMGFSGGDVGRIPALLMPQQLEISGGLNLIDPKQIKDGKLHNVECFRLEYNFRDEQFTLWIDKQSYLVRRIDERIKLDGIRIERTTNYDPTIDGKITDEMLEFDPPASRANNDSANTLRESALGSNDSRILMSQERDADADAVTRKAGQQRSDNQLEMPLCWCPAGKFKMGRKQLPVTLTRGFWMGKHEVTQAQYVAVMGDNPSEYKGESLPVESVKWNDAKKFCQKFTELERKAGRLPKGWEYRLPTEAQWEYACRAGTTLVWDDEKDLVYPSTFGDDLSELADYAWYIKNSDDKTHPVGQKMPNAWGLCDMHGNVSEWVQDAWQSKLSGGEDPEVSVWSPVYTVRGADFFHAAEACSSPFIRGVGLPSPQGKFTGFRVALVSVDGFGDGAAADLKELQGDWETVSLTEGGKSPAAENGFGGLRLQIKGDTFVIAQRTANGKKSEVDTGRIEIDGTATPKTIDFIGRVERRLGIYELKDGVLRVSLVEQAGTDVPAGASVPNTKPLKRPNTLESPAGSNMILMLFQRKSDNSLQTIGDARTLPLVQVLDDANGLTAKRVRIIGTFLVTDNKFGVRTYQISTAREDLPLRPNEGAYRDREVTFKPSFDDEKIINVGQFHNKRVVATGPIYFFPADADSPAEVVFMMDGIQEYQPQVNANEEVPSAVPSEGMSMRHNQPDEISEHTVDLMSVIRKAVLPQNFATERVGWERFSVISVGARGGTASGVLENFRPLLNNFPEPKLSLQELTDDVEVEVKRHPHWKAGVALLGYLEAELGNEERAVKLFEQVLAEKENPITPEAAWSFGLATEGKGAKLDQIVMALYEINVEGERDPATSLRVTAIGSLSRLYARCGRVDEAKQLLQRLAEPEGPSVVCPWARGPLYKDRCTECHQKERSLENYILMANALTDIGDPVEARMSLARIGASFKNAYDSDEAWTTANTIVPDWEYQGKEAFQPAKVKAESRITPQLILKALESGVFNEPNPLKTASREPAFDIDLILGVRGENGKSILFSPVIDMFALAAQAKGADAAIANIRIDQVLADAFQKTSSSNNPDQLEVGIAATVFAFLRNDLDAAEQRIQKLNKPLPAEKVRKAAVGLWLVAREAFKHERTSEYGEKLTERALAAAEEQDDPLWAKAIRGELAVHDQNAIKDTVE